MDRFTYLRATDLFASGTITVDCDVKVKYDTVYNEASFIVDGDVIADTRNHGAVINFDYAQVNGAMYDLEDIAKIADRLSCITQVAALIQEKKFQPL